MTAGSAQELIVKSHGGKVQTLKFTDQTLFLTQTEKKDDTQVPVRQVIGAYFNENTLEVYFLTKKQKKLPFSLTKLEGRVDDNSRVKEWTEGLMDVAYQGIKRCRRLKILVNPYGGPGKARSIFHKTVEPIFRAAKCSMDVTYTTHWKHATEIAREISLVDYDVLVTVSGDGLIHEVINGLAQHPNSAEAFKIPVAPVPAGSANGTSLNLLGMEEGFDVCAATLNAIKGQPMKVDLFSFMQGETRAISFMTQALGLMAELDIGTENWRWMGDTRFFLGFLRGLISFKACPVTLQMKVTEQDKSKMVQAYRTHREADHSGEALAPPNSVTNSGIPPLTQPVSEEDGWVTFDQPVLCIYAGKGPYVGRDLMQFPVSLPDDGLIDIAIQEHTSRGEMLKAVEGGPTGQPFWLDSQRYYKASAYRVRPHQSKGMFALDGESYPFEEFQVEVLKGLGTLMSPYGYYAVDFQEKPKSKPKDAQISNSPRRQWYRRFYYYYLHPYLCFKR